MAQVQSPYGLRVVKNLGEQYFTGGMHTYPCTPAQVAATGLFYGDPVGLQGGYAVPLTATPTNAIPGVIGVFQGAEWMDPIRGYVNSQYVPVGLTGVTNLKVKVSDYPWVIMKVQADGPINYGAPGIGQNAQLAGFGNGSTITGNSKVYLLSASIANTATFAVQIFGFPVDAGPSPGAQSIPGDPFTDVLVVWNFGVDRYLMAAGG